MTSAYNASWRLVCCVAADGGCWRGGNQPCTAALLAREQHLWPATAAAIE